MGTCVTIIRSLVLATFAIGIAAAPAVAAPAKKPPPKSKAVAKPAAKPVAKPAAKPEALAEPEARVPPGGFMVPKVVALKNPTSAEREANAVWNIRAALNVAALQCQFSPFLRTVKTYNSFLQAHSEELSRAQATMIGHFKRSDGARAQTSFDMYTTRTYNSYSTLDAQYAFCNAAGDRRPPRAGGAEGQAGRDGADPCTRDSRRAVVSAAVPGAGGGDPGTDRHSATGTRRRMTFAIDRLVIRRPDDWHVHLRDGAMLGQVVNATARQFARAIVMPNLKPPVTTAAAGAAYRDRILAAVDPALNFTPLITCYLTDGIPGDELARGHGEGVFTAAKLYPAHATTNSAHGVTDVAHIRDALETMQRIGMPLLVHGEVTDSHVDIFDREAVFIDRTLAGLVRDYPALKIVFEHITTAEAVAFVEASGANVGGDDHAASPRHQPQCDVRRRHPAASVLPAGAEARETPAGAAPGGDERQPQVLPRHRQRATCRIRPRKRPAAAPAATTRRSRSKAMRGPSTRKARSTSSKALPANIGPAFYGLPLNTGTVTLERAPVTVPDIIGDVVPFHAGETLGWRFIR